MLINILVGLQLLSMGGLAIAWWGGNHRLALAQVCYCASTLILFAKT